jgi:hypothetical protein
MAPEWTPTQEKQIVPVDFRNVKLGPKGYKERHKRKLDEQEELESCPVAMDEDVAPAGGGKRQKLADGNAYRNVRDLTPHRTAPLAPTSNRTFARCNCVTRFAQVSGKTWKAGAQPASKVMKAASKRSWDKQMTEKRTRQAFKEQKKEAVTALKAKKKVRCASPLSLCVPCALHRRSGLHAARLHALDDCAQRALSW